MQNFSLCTRKAKENGGGGMSMFGDKREPAGLVCTEDNSRAELSLGYLRSTWKYWMFSEKRIHYTKYKGEMCGSSEEKRIYILFATLWKNVHRDVENSCSRTECGVRKHFQKIPVFRGLQLCTVCIQERNTTATQSKVFTSCLMGTCPSHGCHVVPFPHASWSWGHRGWQSGYYAILWRQPFPECETQVWNSELWDKLMHYAFFQGIS